MIYSIFDMEHMFSEAEKQSSQLVLVGWLCGLEYAPIH